MTEKNNLILITKKPLCTIMFAVWEILRSVFETVCGIARISSEEISHSKMFCFRQVIFLTSSCISSAK